MLIAPKHLKLRTSNLTHVFPGTVRTWHPQIFPKRGVFKNLLGGDMHSHERLLVFNQLMFSNGWWDCVSNKKLSEITFGKYKFCMKIMDYPSIKSILWRLTCTKFVCPGPRWRRLQHSPDSLADGKGVSCPLPKNPTPAIGLDFRPFGPQAATFPQQSWFP